jgi:serine/threonine protein kinase
MKKIGRYEIVSEIGRGAMGVVYLAKDPVIDRPLAIKTIRLMGLMKDESEEFLKRFYQEAKAAGNLSHPNIVTIHDAGFDKEIELHYIVMEYIPGKTLKEIIQQKVPLTFEEKAMILEKIADALSYAHSRGIVHRDIKPANIIISGPDSIKITDFGIAKLPASHLTTDGQYLGTPTYMSPEQVLGKAVDLRSDIFSFGIVAYELISYQKPFSGSNLTEVSHKIAYENPIPLKELVPNCPEPLLYIVDKCLSKDPNLRFQNAKDISKELTNFIIIPKKEEKDPEDTIVLKEEKKEEVIFETVIPQKKKKESIRERFVNYFKSKKGLEFLSYEIYFRWVIVIASLWILIWAALIGYLYFKGKSISPQTTKYYFVNPFELKGLILKGRAFLKENQYEKALYYFEKALLVNPSSPYLISEVVGIRSLIDYNLKKEDEKLQVKFYIEKGEEALRKKDYTSAKIHFSKALEIDPKNVEAKEYIDKIDEWRKAKKPIVVPEKPKEEIAQKLEEPKIETPQKKEAKVLEPKMEVRFKSPIPEGYLVISLNGKQIVRKTFNFYVKKGFLGKEFKEGLIEEPVPIKAGQNLVQIWVTKIGKDGFTAYEKLDIEIKNSTLYVVNIFLDEKQKKISLKLEESYLGN